ncbi:enoyl-CoA hydratase/isomerase family protein [Microvirga sp. W0021]|uniref:3-hydroxyisobutyryl-CoA hydrolase n=1 Tax=Hohaiivirga grylli TaxID=3133970 RepID=A0ABV0BI26_9HYPH
MSMAPEVICEKKGSVGVITLNRPRALNALSRDMVQGMSVALAEWKDDPAIKAVIVKGAGEKAFCAGGDVRTLREYCLAGMREEALDFWYEEYILNTQIHRFPKPYISLIGGIVMGGGVGVSIHGSYRVAGDNYLFAMPEVGIGFFPDVGAAYPLSRVKSQFGTYLAITGDRVKRDDAIYLGLATHAVATSDFDNIEQKLADGEDVDTVLAEYAVKVQPSHLAEQETFISETFSAETVIEIINRVRNAAEHSEFAQHLLKCFEGKSPTSMCVSLEQMRRAAKLDFDGVMEMDYRLSCRLCELGQDFFEGVRAVLVDKDNWPRWSPAKLEDVKPEVVSAYFEPLASKEFKAP